MHGTGSLVAAVALLSLTACVSTQQTSGSASQTAAAQSAERNRSEPANRRPARIHRVNLSAIHAEVGRPYQSRLVVSGEELKRPEYAAHPIPPGLQFDAASGTLRGVPERPGFYRLTLAVRERPEENNIDFGRLDRRWFTEEVELAIYTPIDEGDE